MKQLQASLDCTDWDMFVSSCDNLDELAETVSDYINFCVDTLIPCKRIRVFPNNKPWINGRVKQVINEKK